MKMKTVKYEADFEKSIIKCSGIKMSNDSEEKCYQFSRDKSATMILGVGLLQPGKIVKEKWLYGPATQLVTKSVLYPCSRFKCGIPCLCMQCEMKHPSCHIPASNPCSYEECKIIFEDHSQYHAALHLGCKYCLNLIETIPNINFTLLKVENYKQVVLGRTDKLAIKPLEIELEPKAPKFSLDLLIKKNKKEDVGGVYCDFCDSLLWSIPQLREHIKLNHVASKIFRHNYDHGDFKCYQCSNYFSSSLNLNRHIDSVHYFETFVCKKCGESYNRKDNLRRHMKSHKKNKFPCNICGKQFTRTDILNRHKKVHSSEAGEELKCELCATKFTRKDNYEMHRKGIHDENGAFVHECTQCKENFCTSKLLRSHCNSNHKTNISCEECGQSFTLKSSLEFHIKRRNPVTCGECGKTFCNTKALSIHKNDIHDHAECDMCGKKFEKIHLQHHKFWVHNQTPNK